MRSQPLNATDAYKLSHKGFMDDKTEYLYSNQTARSSKHMPVDKKRYDNKYVPFGIQGCIMEYLIEEWNENFFNKPKDEVIKKFKRRVDHYVGKDKVSMNHFEELHDLGYLPIRIKALPEGAAVPIRIPFMTIVNTHPSFAWLTNYLETVLSCEIWKSCYAATLGRELKRVVNEFADKTVGDRNHTMFQLHGFEFRGMSGRYDAAKAGAGLLLSTYGTDTIVAIDYLEDYYGANVENEIVALSVPASEHAVTSLGTSVESELEFFRKAITEDYPIGIVSLVADTYDFFSVITDYAERLKDDILRRQPDENGLAKVVFRPDSGDPADILCGIDGSRLIETDSGKLFLAFDKNHNLLNDQREVSEAEVKGAVECLWDVFGGTISPKGYKILNERVGLIYGDAILQSTMLEIFKRLEAKGFASSNIVLGVGSYSMQYCTRDSLGLAQKATWAQVDGKAFDLYKDPKTDTGMKKSAKGLLKVYLDENDEYALKEQCSPEEEKEGELRTVFLDGKLVEENTCTLAQIRERIEKSYE